MTKNAWGWMTLLLLLLLAAAAIWGALIETGSALRAAFIFIVAVLLGLCMLAGYLVNSRIDGILIDDRNRVSLERLQWTAWLIVLFGTYFAEAAWNIGHGGSFPGIQVELLALLGIVSASPVVSNVIVDAKKRQSSGPTLMAHGGAPVLQAVQPMAAGDSPRQVGAMDVNATVREASWADLYLGEEAATRYVVDISRLQKLVITVLLVVTYVGMAWTALKGASGPFADLPGIDDKFVWLLGLSHASYLAYKATPKTQN